MMQLWLYILAQRRENKYIDEFRLAGELNMRFIYVNLERDDGEFACKHHFFSVSNLQRTFAVNL